MCLRRFNDRSQLVPSFNAKNKSKQANSLSSVRLGFGLEAKHIFLFWEYKLFRTSQNNK